jgi:hypothetical protein
LSGELHADGELLCALEQRVALVAITASQRDRVAGVGWQDVAFDAVDG